MCKVRKLIHGSESVAPVWDPDDGKVGCAGGVFFRRAESLIEMPDGLFAQRVGSVVGKLTKADAKVAFVSIVDPVVILPHLNGFQSLDFFPSVGHSGRLVAERFRRVIGGVETVLGEMDGAGIAIAVAHVGTLHPGVENFDVVRGDFFGVKAHRSLVVFPSSRMAQRLGVGMVGECPRKVSFSFRPANKFLHDIAGGIEALVDGFGPVVGEGDEGARIGVLLAGDEVDESARAMVEIEVIGEGLFATVGPSPTGIDLVVNNVVMNAAVFAIGAGVSAGEQMKSGTIHFDRLLTVHIGHRKNAFGVGIRVTHGLDGGVAAASRVAKKEHRGDEGVVLGGG